MGIKNGSSKLTEKQVLEIRSKYKPSKSDKLSDGYSMNKLAKEYNVSRRHIINIIKKKNWKHV